MYKKVIYWDIYEVTTRTISINGVMLRGRIRKLCLENKRNVLVENTQDIEKSVRFVVPKDENISLIQSYLHSILADIEIILVKQNTPNPVLSKLKVNFEERYSLQ